MNEDHIRQQIREQSMHNANQRGITYKEDPEWISVTSGWIGVIVGVICFIALLADNNGKQVEPSTFFFIVIPSSIIGGLMIKAISYAILVAIYEGGKYAKQGTVAATKEGSRLLDNATSTIAKKITIAVERGKTEAKIEQEKQKLKEQIIDLELQQLRKRVEELEKETGKN